MDILVRPDSSKGIPILLTLPFQLGAVATGLFLLAAFGAQVITDKSDVSTVGIKISFMSLFIVGIVVLVLLIIVC